MDIIIRNASPDDYEALLPLFRQVHEFHVQVRPDLYKENPVPVEQEYFENQLMDGRHHIFVAVLSNETVGVAVTKEEETAENTIVKERKILSIKSLCVAKPHRKKGIGKKLMSFVFDFGRTLKVDGIELGVSEENPSAIEFYKSIGMKTKRRKMEMILN